VQESNHTYFELLKKEIVEKMRQSYPGINPSISEWKGQEIVDFQEELSSGANGQISEKWFYTHMKSGSRTLPRIDVLNLLSRYAGYANWDDFLFRHADPAHPTLLSSRPNRVFIWIPLLAVLILAVIVVLFKLVHTREYKFCFYDADTREPITNSLIEITLLRDKESPVNYLCSRDGCFSLKTGEAHIRFIARSPYYLPDTIDRILDKFRPDEQVKLRPNNFALMISYFSQMKVKDWQKRRIQLDRMIEDTAVICQVYGITSTGMELFTKWEFINKLTLPSASLKGFEVLDTRIKGDKIQLLRFMIREDTKR
jgi:hypothetical protein